MSKFSETVYIDEFFNINTSPEECDAGLIAIYKLVGVKKLSFNPTLEDVEDEPGKKVKKVKKSGE